MTIFRCKAEGGWSGFVTTVAAARPGDTVFLPAGTFTGSVTINIPSGVTVEGAGAHETQLIYQAEGEAVGPAVSICEAEGVNLRNVCLAANVQNVPRRILPDSEVLPFELTETDIRFSEWGLVWVNKASRINLSLLQLTGARFEKWLRGISVRQSSGVDVNACIISEFGGSGISVFSSDAQVNCSQVFQNGGNGILGSSSRLSAIQNLCHDNERGGILVAAGLTNLLDNDCRGNTWSGILIERDLTNPTEVPKGTIKGNRCHENKEAGIVVSSCAMELLDNECWGNTSCGIGVQRDPRIPMETSTGTIKGNRCHENKGAGIAVFSCAVELLDNECWGNTSCGIGVQRDPRIPMETSTGTIKGNRCHDNETTGISVLSCAMEVLNNECWGNPASGISIQRADETPTEASSGTVTGNRCHENGRAGISVYSGAADVRDNECWGNLDFGIRIERSLISPTEASAGTVSSNCCHHNGQGGYLIEDGQSIDIGNNSGWANVRASLVKYAAIGAHSAGRAESPDCLKLPPPDDWLMQRRRQQVDGALAAKLETAALSNVEALAAFVGGEGCDDCLDAFLFGRRHQEQPGAGVDNVDLSNSKAVMQPDSYSHVGLGAVNEGHSQLPPQVPWREVVRTADRETKHLAGAEILGARGRSPLQRVLQMVDRHIKKDISGVRAMCVVADDSAWVDQVVEGLGDLQRDGQTSANPAVRSIAPRLSLAGASIAGPFVVEHGVRSLNALNRDTNTYPLMEDALLEGRSVALERILAALTNPQFYLALSVLPFVLFLFVAIAHLRGFDGSWLNVGGALGYSFSEALKDIQITSLFEIGTIVAGAAWLVAQLNKVLPRRLHVPETILNRMVDRATRALRGDKAKLNEDNAVTGDDIADDDNWDRLIKRRVFGGRSTVASVVIVRQVSYWSEQDIAALTRLCDLCPQDQQLFLLFDVQDLALVESAFIRAVSDENIPLEGFEYPERANKEFGKIGVAPETSLGTLHALLGTSDLAEREQRDLLTYLENETFEAIDLLPMLVFGSTPELPFQLTRRVSSTDKEWAVPLEQEIAPYISNIMAHDSQYAYNAKANIAPLELALRCARDAQAIATNEIPGKPTAKVQMTGRAGFKTHLFAELNRQFQEDGKHAGRYVKLFLGCGEAHALLSAQRLVTSEPAPLSLDLLHRCHLWLRAAHRLAKENDNIALEAGASVTRQRQQVMGHWRAFVDACEHTQIASGDNEKNRAAWLYARALTGYELVSGQAGDLQPAAKLFDAIMAWQPPASAYTPHDALFEDIKIVFDQFETCDGQFIMRQIEGLLASEWRHMPPSLAERIRTEANSRASRGLKLDALFAVSTESNEWQALVDRHSFDIPRVMTAIFCLLSRSIGRDSTDALPLGQLLATYREQVLDSDENPEDDRSFVVTTQFNSKDTVAAFLLFSKTLVERRPLYRIGGKNESG